MKTTLTVLYFATAAVWILCACVTSQARLRGLFVVAALFHLAGAAFLTLGTTP